MGSRDKRNGTDAFLCTLDRSTFIGSSLTPICHFYGRDVNRGMTTALLILMLSNPRGRRKDLGSSKLLVGDWLRTGRSARLD